MRVFIFPNTHEAAKGRTRRLRGSPEIGASNRQGVRPRKSREARAATNLHGQRGSLGLGPDVTATIMTRGCGWFLTYATPPPPNLCADPEETSCLYSWESVDECTFLFADRSVGRVCCAS